MDRGKQVAGWTRRAVAGAMLGAALPVPARSAGLDVSILWLERRVDRPATLSSLDQPPADEGRPGARVAIAEAMATGRLLGQRFTLAERLLEPDDDLSAALHDAIAGPVPAAIVASLPAAELPVLAELAEPRGITVLNAASPD